MSVTEAERHHLYEVLKAHLGAASADTLMNLIPPIGWSDLATKSDLASTKAELTAEIAGLRGDMAREISTAQSELSRTFGTWLFASQAAVIAAMAVIVGLLG
ncbi:MAG: hypothetical protein EA389_15000 [Ilumatobacter sp.]|nr:MAG: hypothetical protein EA389_15000 [Ilumatobacter sp.]